MGIPRFVSQWVRRQPGALTRSLPTTRASLSIDMNGILHACAQQVYAYGQGENPDRQVYVSRTPAEVLEREYFVAVTIKIREVLLYVAPTEVLILAVDGVAPSAKIKQQRQRRFLAASQRLSGAAFDSNAITTGTEFMQRLDAYLQTWLNRNAFSLPPTVLYSGHTVPGEGEHKIMEFYRTRPEFVSSGKYHFLYGLDADLIVLSMLAPVERIILVREDNPDVVDIYALKSALARQSVTPHDFAVMMCLAGNDFLPNLLAFYDLSTSINAMIQVFTTLRPGALADARGAIAWPAFSAFISTIAKNELTYLNDLLATQSSARDPRQQVIVLPLLQKALTDGKLNLPSVASMWYEHALLPPPLPEGVIDVWHPDEWEVSPERFNTMLVSYLQGIAWVMKYYCVGHLSVHQGYMYSEFYAPLLQDLAVMAELVAKQPETIQTVLRATPSNTMPFQLLSVLPRKSAGLLPEPLRPYALGDTSPLADLYPTSFRVDEVSSSHPVALVPPIDPKRIGTISEGMRKYLPSFYYTLGTTLILRRVDATGSLRRRTLPSAPQAPQPSAEQVVTAADPRTQWRAQGALKPKKETVPKKRATLEGLRKYHNKCKELILESAPAGRLLDLGSGRGGDLGKWERLNKFTQIVAVDPNEAHLNEFRKRLQETYKSLQGKVLILQAGAQDSEKVLAALGGKVDVITMMLSLTFFFQSKTMLEQLMTTLELASHSGTKFMTLFPSGERVVEAFDAASDARGTKRTLRLPEKGVSMELENKTFSGELTQRVYVSFEDTIVENQTEWLVDGAVWKQIMNQRGWYLERENVTLPPSGLTETERILCNMYVEQTWVKKEPSALLEIQATPTAPHPSVDLDALTKALETVTLVPATPAPEAPKKRSTKKAPVGASPLVVAATKGQVQTISELLTAGEDVHAEEEAALRAAITANKYDAIKVLLDAGAYHLSSLTGTIKMPPYTMPTPPHATLTKSKLTERLVAVGVSPNKSATKDELIVLLTAFD
jgi:hypothetical protein